MPHTHRCVPTQDGNTYFSTVRAYNPGGLSTVASSDGVRVDVTAPDIQGDDHGLEHVSVTSNPALTTLVAAWPTAGGVSEFLWKVGTTSHANDVLELASAGTASTATITNIAPPLAVGTTYYVDVFARTAVGVFLYAHGSMLADNTPPLITGLLANGGALFNSSTPTLNATYVACLVSKRCVFPPAG